ncbi:MAG: hypothetical protein M2R45_03564 [Verrucomicrobia subdivision 3 bacterium]|nr:hypothetical protein [Limisphaerales bacterium]MCS1416459.1 hypothetical protein [Limisphaerales bacterium]
MLPQPPCHWTTFIGENSGLEHLSVFFPGKPPRGLLRNSRAIHVESIRKEISQVPVASSLPFGI